MIDEIIEEEQVLEVNLENDIINVATTNYEELINKPQINSIELIGNKSLDDLNIQKKGNYANTRITNAEIDNLF